MAQWRAQTHTDRRPAGRMITTPAESDKVLPPAPCLGISLMEGVPQIDASRTMFTTWRSATRQPMVEKHVGQGSQYLWTYRDAGGNFFDGAKTYRLHIPPNIPAGNFWSVLVYDALSRSETPERAAVPVREQLHQARSSMRTAPSTSRSAPMSPRQKAQLDQDSPWKRLFSNVPLLWPCGSRSSTRHGKLEDVVGVK